MAPTVQYAGFMRRVAAFAIDSLILLILTTPLLFFFAGGGTSSGPGRLQALAAFDWGRLLIDDLLPMALALFFWVRFRATPGKQLMDCEVVDAATLNTLRPWQALLRYLGYIVSLLPLGLGFLWILWDSKRRGFHDYVANSVVVLNEREPLAEQSLETLMREVE